MIEEGRITVDGAPAVDRAEGAAGVTMLVEVDGRNDPSRATPRSGGDCPQQTKGGIVQPQ